MGGAGIFPWKTQHIIFRDATHFMEHFTWNNTTFSPKNNYNYCINSSDDLSLLLGKVDDEFTLNLNFFLLKTSQQTLSITFLQIKSSFPMRSLFIFLSKTKKYISVVSTLNSDRENIIRDQPTPKPVLCPWNNIHFISLHLSSQYWNNTIQVICLKFKLSNSQFI